MKLGISEKAKHQIIGVAVVISIGAMFAPTLINKSSQQNLEKNFSVHVKLPPHPEAPNVAVADEDALYKTIKVAHVNIPTVSGDSALPSLAKAQKVRFEEVTPEGDIIKSKESFDVAAGKELVHIAANQSASNVMQANVEHNNPIKITNAVKSELKVASVAKMKQVAVVSQKSAAVIKPKVAVVSRPKIVAPQVVAKVSNETKPAVRTAIYAVQLASFSQVNNAQGLVSKLHAKGYKATYLRTTTPQGAVLYKVYAGHSTRKDEVVRLQSQLASAMQLNGLIVNTGVS
jgi:DedD protein